MQYLGVEYSVRHMPELDPDFIPFGVWLEAYARGAEKPLTIALERDQGKISVRETKIHGTPEMAEADYRYVERYVKFLLWSVGGFRITKLENGTYVLKETKAPNGYKLPDPNNGYTITITDDGVTWNPSLTGSNITNSRETGVVTWNKVSSDSKNNKKLNGSEWKLTKTESFSWNANGAAQYTEIAAEQQPSVTITDCKLGKGNTCSASDGQSFYDVDPVEGQFKLKGLEWGTYTLVETKAPDGYDIDSTVRKFTFGPATGTDGTGQWNSNGVASAAGDATGDFTTSSANYDSSVFNFSVGDIKNQPGVVLPATGGTGNSWIYATAMAVALIGVVAAGMALKVRRRQ